jgi:hypothetical protein
MSVCLKFCWKKWIWVVSMTSATHVAWVETLEDRQIEMTVLEKRCA